MTVVVPDVGTGAATLSVWFAAVGDPVIEGDRVAEVLIPGATVDIAAPVSGEVTALLASVGDRLAAGQVIAELRPDDPD